MSKELEDLLQAARLHTFTPAEKEEHRRSFAYAQIAQDKTPYYRALEAADAASVSGNVDVSQLESLLDTLLARQLFGVLSDARAGLGVQLS